MTVAGHRGFRASWHPVTLLVQESERSLAPRRNRSIPAAQSVVFVVFLVSDFPPGELDQAMAAPAVEAELWVAQRPTVHLPLPFHTILESRSGPTCRDHNYNPCRSQASLPLIDLLLPRSTTCECVPFENPSHTLRVASEKNSRQRHGVHGELRANELRAYQRPSFKKPSSLRL